MSDKTHTLRLRVSSVVAEVVKSGAPRERQLEAARGGLALADDDLVTALFFLCHNPDREIQTQALRTLRGFPADRLGKVMGREEVSPRLLDLVARVRMREPAVIRDILENPGCPDDAVIHLARHGDAPVLNLLMEKRRKWQDLPALAEALAANPHCTAQIREKLGLAGPAAGQVEEPADSGEAPEEEEEINLTKYQQALEMQVAEKIKMALTGDKEWRTLLGRDANKLVSSAVMKNPRITEGEVLTIAKNKGATDDQIRLITLNREWTRNYELKKALVVNPRTPLPKALRYMNVLTEKDLKLIIQSRSVAMVIVNNARRLLLAKEKKR